MTPEPAKLCDLNDIGEGDCGGFSVERDGRMESFIVIRSNGRAFVYVNSCPHIGSPLDLAPGRFLSVDKSMILCSSHGALFRIADGHCVSGPYTGQGLTPVATDIRDGAIYLTG